MADTSFSDVDLETVLFRLVRYSQALFGAVRMLGVEPVDIAYAGGDGPEDLAMNLILRFLNPIDASVKWRDDGTRPNTERLYAYLKKALERDFFDLKKSKRYTTTVYLPQVAGDETELSLERLAVYLETPEGLALRKERVRLIIEEFSDDPMAQEIVRLQLEPEGYNAFTNQELAVLLETSVDCIENCKKRVKNRLLQIQRRQEKGEAADA